MSGPSKRELFPPCGAANSPRPATSAAASRRRLPRPTRALQRLWRALGSRARVRRPSGLRARPPGISGPTSSVRASISRRRALSAARNSSCLSSSSATGRVSEGSSGRRDRRPAKTAGAIGAFRTCLELQSGQTTNPRRTWLSYPAPSGNQLSNVWPRSHASENLIIAQAASSASSRPAPSRS